MTEIKLKKRYPQSKVEDITDAFMRGYEQGRTDGLKVGRQITLAVVESYLTKSKERAKRRADRKTEPQYSEEDMYWLSLAEDVANGKMSDAGANQAWLEYINHKDELQTDCAWR